MRAFGGVARVCIVAAAVVCTAAASIAQAETGARPQGWGPFHYSSQSVLQMLRYAYMHEHPALAGVGELHGSGSISWTNTWDHRPGQYRVDGESLFFRPKLSYGLSDRLEGSVLWPLIYVGGGILDGLIVGAHGLLGAGNMKRELFPRGQLRIERANPDGTTTVFVDDEDAGGHTLAPVLALRYRLTEPGADWPLTVKAAVNVPELEGDNMLVEVAGRDWALGLATATRINAAWAATFSVAYVNPRGGGVRGGDMPTQPFLWSFLASVDQALDGDNALIYQLTHETPVGENSGTGFDNPTTEFLFGWKGQSRHGYIWEFGVIENLFIHDNNVDFGFHFGVTRILI